MMIRSSYLRLNITQLPRQSKTISPHPRDGLCWSDGEALTADDFVFTINMLNHNPELRGATDINEATAAERARCRIRRSALRD